MNEKREERVQENEAMIQNIDRWVTWRNESTLDVLIVLPNNRIFSRNVSNEVLETPFVKFG